LRIVDILKDTQIAHAETMHVLKVSRQTSISSAIASWMTFLSSSTGISIILRFTDLIISPSYGNPLIIAEKPKKNNHVCQEKSLYHSAIRGVKLDHDTGNRSHPIGGSGA
jgi:hypothetical protein